MVRGRLLVVLLSLVVAFAAMPAAAAGDTAGARLQADEEVLAGEESQAVEEGRTEDDDPIDVPNPQPPSEATKNEPEPNPSGRVRTGPHTADQREVATDNLEPLGVVVPAKDKVVQIPSQANRAAFNGTPLKVVVDKQGIDENVNPRARLKVSKDLAAPAGALTPLFRVNLEDQQGRALGHEKPLKLELDFSDHASTLQGNLAGRLPRSRHQSAAVLEARRH